MERSVGCVRFIGNYLVVSTYIKIASRKSGSLIKSGKLIVPAVGDRDRSVCADDYTA